MEIRQHQNKLGTEILYEIHGCPVDVGIGKIVDAESINVSTFFKNILIQS